MPTANQSSSLSVVTNMWRFLCSSMRMGFVMGVASTRKYNMTVNNNTNVVSSDCVPMLWSRGRGLVGLFLFVFALMSAPHSANATSNNVYVQNGLDATFTLKIGTDGFVTGGYVPYQTTLAPYGSASNSFSDPDAGDGPGVEVQNYSSSNYKGYYCVKASYVSMAAAIASSCLDSKISPSWASTRYKGLTHQNGNFYVYIDVGVAPGCPATTLKWGANSFCESAVPTTSVGESLGLTNTKAGASGVASATCSNGTWVVSSPSCTSNLAQPTSFIATDGTSPTSIGMSWDAVPNAASYTIQYRVQGAGSWADLTTTPSTSHTWATSSYSKYEFQVRADNGAGSSLYSSTDLGWIRPLIDASFVSQSDIPAKIGVNKAFTFSQVWRNTGSETWTGASYGTASHDTNGAITWGVPFTVFAGSTANSAQVTQTLTATAPAVPGTYTLQRIMQKSGTSYGTPSTLASIVVLGTPECSAVTPDIATTYNPNATVTAKLAGASSVEAATIRVWGDIQGEPNGATYSMIFNGTDWVATFPVASHLSPSENKINIRASVSNSEFPSSVCATSSMAFEQLPLPVVTLTPTFGSYAEGADQGFVVNRANGEFAKVLVDLGSYSSSLKAKVEVLDVAQANTILPLNNVTPNAQTNMVMTPPTLASTPASWVKYTASVRVSYADAVAAAQNKVATVSISWTAAPTGLIVNATGIDAATATIAAAIAPSAASFDSALHGSFTGYARIASNATTVGSTQAVDTTGAWNVINLDYSQLYANPLVAVARAVPPAGITLVAPLEFVSAAFTLPVQRPLSVSATDGTREDDVQVVWPAVATGSAIRYRVFRDGVEISPVVGITSLEFIDTPPVRGTVYTYSIKTMVNNVSSNTDANDTGFVPACRAPRLVGASLNAEMTAITGLVERWECLTEAKGTGSVDSGSSTDVTLDGTTTYRSFSYPLDPTLPDGAHVMHLGLQSQGVTINADRTYDIPFTLAKSAITIKSLTILYDGNTAKDGMDASSIGRFGVRMEGGTGLGFAEESQ